MAEATHRELSAQVGCTGWGWQSQHSAWRFGQCMLHIAAAVAAANAAAAGLHVKRCTCWLGLHEQPLAAPLEALTSHPAQVVCSGATAGATGRTHACEPLQASALEAATLRQDQDTGRFERQVEVLRRNVSAFRDRLR